jgi:DNA modification methylase
MNKIYYDKCENILPTLPSECVDLTVTSPPYADATTYGDKVNIFSPENYPDWFIPITNEIYRVSKATSSMIININDKLVNCYRSTYVFNLIHRITQETNWKLYDRYTWYKRSGLPNASQKQKLFDRTEYIFHFVKDAKQCKNYPNRIRIPYQKSSLTRMKYIGGTHDNIDSNGITTTKMRKIEPNPLGRLPDGVFRFPTSGTLKGDNHGLHPASFHPDLPKFFIHWLSDTNDVVLDPFLGAGTTAAVSRYFNRQYIGIEMNKEYKKIIENNVNKYKPTNLSTKFFGDK